MEREDTRTEQRRRKRRTSLKGLEEVLTGLWNDGLSDGQIAERIGCTVGAIQHWRARNRLPGNYDRGRPPEDPAAEEPPKRAVSRRR